MMNKQNLGSEEELGCTYKDGICTELCLNLWFERDWYFLNITESGWFWKQLSRNKVPKDHFFKSVWKSNYPEVHCRTLDVYFQVIKYQLPLRSSIKLVIIDMTYTVWKAIHQAISASS